MGEHEGHALIYPLAQTAPLQCARAEKEPGYSSQGLTQPTFNPICHSRWSFQPQHHHTVQAADVLSGCAFHPELPFCVP